MVAIYSTVHCHVTNKLNSQNSTSETTHLKQFPLNTLVLHTNFTPVQFSNKLELIQIVPKQLSNIYLMLRMNL